MSFLHRPHRIWWRKAIFQIHLWVGLTLCLYMFVIGVSGSILVFQDELESLCYGRLIRAPEASGTASVPLPEIVANVRDAYPDGKISVAYLPKKSGENYTVFVGRKGSVHRVYVSPVSGRIIGDLNPRDAWLVWVAQLHFRLFAGKVGTLLNGIGGACLLLLCASGVVIWWAGLAHWTRRLKVNLRCSWKRINSDLHSAVGIWVLLLLSMWAFTDVYFVWPKPIEAFVGRFSSVASVEPPKFSVPPRRKQPWPGMELMIQRAENISPNAKLAGALFPGNDKGALTILMARGRQGDFTKMDYVYFDPSTAKPLAVWHRGISPTWGGKFLFLLEPLHFGIYWGMGVKILWAVLGCALPLLAITGVLMYWNRSLSKKWKTLQARPANLQESAEINSIA